MIIGDRYNRSQARANRWVREWVAARGDESRMVHKTVLVFATGQVGSFTGFVVFDEVDSDFLWVVPKPPYRPHVCHRPSLVFVGEFHNERPVPIGDPPHPQTKVQEYIP